MAAAIKDLAQVNADLQAQKERVETVDFKMITFSLGGKDYGVDILNVKEIAKADKFTFVPNAASFVRGVYNLRGDIIPVIDLRTFFHLPAEKKIDDQENMLILRINEQVYGTVVDRIDKVVGVNKEALQPPHPIFGDINVKYISGIMEKEGELYVILDVMRIFSQKEEVKEKGLGSVGVSGDFFVPPPAEEMPEERKEQPAVVDSAIGFLAEGLAALKHFAVSPLNEGWMSRRFAEWRTMRAGGELQLRNAADAEEYLSDFYSPYSGSFWGSSYAKAVKDALPELSSVNIQVWNVGCGKGYETLSFACILKTRYPKSQIKIWANDNDIMAISQAPNMIFELANVPDYCQSFLVKGNNGYSFNQEIKDSVIFEYHDVLHDNPLPGLDIILARDTLSFFSAQEQEGLVNSFSEKLKSQGMVILGKNEELLGSKWVPISSDLVSAFMYNA
ncbi:MAG: chemotaxis protein CheW [Treponema sp.]|nr:chemotaxis protein CheW [Treponema sp.]